MMKLVQLQARQKESLHETENRVRRNNNMCFTRWMLALLLLQSAIAIGQDENDRGA